MADLITAEITGIEEVRAKMGQVSDDLTGSPMETTMRKATLIVMRDARKNAPVDRERLRASITPEVITQATEVQGIVGSNVIYAPYQELGTRAFTPPWAPLFQWALRKTQGSAKAARALAAAARISIRARGIVAKRFLQRALEDNSQKIFNLLGNVVTTIVEK